VLVFDKVGVTWYHLAVINVGLKFGLGALLRDLKNGLFGQG
jgi:hypothetical protein